MRPPRRLVLALPALLAGTLLAACGSGGEGADGGDQVPAQAPAAATAEFPPAEGQTLVELQQQLPEGPILAPSVRLLQPGANRVGFALFDAAGKQMSGAQVALYTARPDGTGLRGPFPARSESLEVKPQFRSRQAAENPDVARAIYVADVPFKRRGDQVIAAVARLDGRLVSTAALQVEVGAAGATPPDVGERAPRVSTPTIGDVAGDSSKIDTRIPPAPSLQQVDAADVLGRKPLVLTFATSQRCRSKVCGPVTDIVLQVSRQTGDDVAFVHQEIYRDNSIDRGFLPQVRAYHLTTEPWTFVIDRTGVVRARFEGAMSVTELQKAVDEVRGT